jgi:hypothetical protein
MISCINRFFKEWFVKSFLLFSWSQYNRILFFFYLIIFNHIWTRFDKAPQLIRMFCIRFHIFYISDLLIILVINISEILFFYLINIVFISHNPDMLRNRNVKCWKYIINCSSIPDKLLIIKIINHKRLIFLDILSDHNIWDFIFMKLYQDINNRPFLYLDIYLQTNVDLKKARNR